uniref:G protein-coupled receptor n=1 Tax=Pristionchus pacificus TaxID=54126 RepID=A0A8R1YYJ4_PRIPA
MELPLFRFNIWMDDYEQYNCSALGDIDWHERGTNRPYLGAFCIIFGALAIPPYFLCALVMAPMRGNSVYKVGFSYAANNVDQIMIFLAAADIADLMFASVGYGVMSITVIFFFCSTTSCALLALNRFGEMLSIDWIIWFFQGSRTWAVLLISTIPVGLLVLFTPPMLFNSKYHMLFFDPMIYDGKYVYDSYVHFACVTFMPTFSLILYLLMIAGLFLEYGNIAKMRQSNAFGRATFQIVRCDYRYPSNIHAQYGIICPMKRLVFLSAFQVLQFIPVSAIDSALYFAHFGWMMVHEVVHPAAEVLTCVVKSKLTK